MTSNNAETMKSATNELLDAASKLAEELYRQAAAKQGTPGAEVPHDGADSQPPKGEVFDAEFKEKDDKKGEKDDGVEA